MIRPQSMRLPVRARAAATLVLLLTACASGTSCEEIRQADGRVETPTECSMNAAFPGGFPHRPPNLTGGGNAHDLVLTWEAATPLAEALDFYREALGTEPVDTPEGPAFEATVDGTDVVVVVNRDGLDAVTVEVYRP